MVVINFSPQLPPDAGPVEDCQQLCQACGCFTQEERRLNQSLPTPGLNTGGKSNEAQIFLTPVLPNRATPKLKEDQVPTPYYKSRIRRKKTSGKSQTNNCQHKSQNSRGRTQAEIFYYILQGVPEKTPHF
jgi:hypothetical protein